AHRRRRAAQPSSPDRALAGRVRRHGNRHRTPTDPSPRPPRSRSARSDPPAATHPSSAATETPARDRTPRSSATPPHRRNPTGRHPALRNSLHAKQQSPPSPGVPELVELRGGGGARAEPAPPLPPHGRTVRPT